jgi:hypothetical protein
MRGPLPSYVEENGRAKVTAIVEGRGRGSEMLVHRRASLSVLDPIHCILFAGFARHCTLTDCSTTLTSIGQRSLVQSYVYKNPPLMHGDQKRKSKAFGANSHTDEMRRPSFLKRRPLKTIKRSMPGDRNEPSTHIGFHTDKFGLISFAKQIYS